MEFAFHARIDWRRFEYEVIIYSILTMQFFVGNTFD